MRDKRVAILESRLGTQMVELVAKHGGLPLHAPALAEVPDVDPAYVKRLVHDAQTRPAKVAIFQTGVGTRALFATTDVLGLTQSLLSPRGDDRRGPRPQTDGGASRTQGTHRLECPRSVHDARGP